MLTAIGRTSIFTNLPEISKKVYVRSLLPRTCAERISGFQNFDLQERIILVTSSSPPRTPSHRVLHERREVSMRQFHQIQVRGSTAGRLLSPTLQQRHQFLLITKNRLKKKSERNDRNFAKDRKRWTWFFAAAATLRRDPYCDNHHPGLKSQSLCWLHQV